MKPNHHNIRRAGTALLGLLTLHSTLAQVAPAPKPTAGETAKKEDVTLLEAFVTTGSNIQRLDVEKTLPVTVVSAEMIEARDSATPMDLLIGIPQVTDIPSNETSVNAVAARGGNANVALRGIGAANTLVVLNGRRNPFHPFNTSSVNVNTLPTSGLQQIEVLRDGASAIYGSDAVAGVINYVTKKKPEGGEFSLRYGMTEHGGGMDIKGDLTYGKTFADGKGSWLTNVSLYNRDAIFWREREWSSSGNKSTKARPPFNVAGSSYDTTTNVSRWPSFLVNGSTTVRWFFPTDLNPTSTPSLTTTALPRSLYADYNQFTTGQPMSARGSVYNRLEYDLTPKLRVFGEISGYSSKSQTGRQPITLNSSDSVVTLSANNPYNPFGSRFYNATGTANADGTARLTGTPQTISINTLLLTEGGPEKITASDKLYRLVGGFGGTIGNSSWTWETAALLGGVSSTDFGVNSVRDSYLRAAALRTDATAWNPFGYTFKVQNGAVVADSPYRNPQSVIDYYTTSANRYGHSKIASYDARAGGNVINYWAGSLAASFGIEWRYEFKEDHKDPFTGANPAGIGPDGAAYNTGDNDILVMSPKLPYAASRTIGSAYAETVAPLVSPRNNIPLVRSLEFSSSVRYERYSDFGGVTKPKFGLSWKPANSVMVRGSLNKGFRAPDLEDLYRPPSFTVATPPGNRDAVRNNFFTQTAVALPADIQVLNKTYTIANPALKPEESEGRSVGLTFEVPRIKGLSFSIDYWELTQKNLNLSQTRDSDVDNQMLRAYTQSQLALGKNINDIDVGYRTTPDDLGGKYVGDPYTLRLPVTAADRALFAQANARLAPGSQLAPVGQWVGATTQFVNGTGRNFTNGFDYNMAYSLPRTRLGQWRISTDWAMFLNKFSKTTPTSLKNDTVIGMTTPKWKGSATVTWRKESWSASLSANYSSMVGSGATTTLANYNLLNQPDYIKVVFNNAATSYREVGSDQLQINGGFGYRFGRQSNSWVRNTAFRLGINNLLDKEPNLTNAASGYSGATGTSLWVGRAYTLTITRQL